MPNVKFSLTVKNNVPENLSSRMENAFLRIMTAGALKTIELAEEKAPVAKYGDNRGTLRKSFKKAKITHEGFTVYTDAEFAPYVEFGTGIFSTHPAAPRKPIRPKNAKVLHWVGEHGEDVFAMEVKGQKPQPFLLPAGNEVIIHIQRLIAEAIRKYKK